MQSTSVIVIILVVALVATAVVVGSKAFRSNTVDASRDAIATELKDLATASVKHFNRPAFMGGGAHSFKNLDKLKRKNTKSRDKKDKNKDKNVPPGTQVWETEAGTYYVVIAAKDSAVIEGVGEEIGRDGVNPVAVQLTVKQYSSSLKILN